MKLFSAEIMTSESSTTAKAVIVKKSKNHISVLNHYTTEPDNLKALSGDAPVYFSVNYYDTIIETLNVPPVKDPRTFELMAKNKLKDRLEEGEEYLTAYKCDQDGVPDANGNFPHRVYMIPKALYADASAISAEQKQKTDMFTLSDLALCGLSAKSMPGKVVFHAFADKDKMVMTVSKDETVYYTRMMDYDYGDGSGLDSVFYEGINLTFMFASKNMHLEVDVMVLSGLLSDMTELSSMLFEYSKKPQAVINHATVVGGCERDTFHEFMIPIALCMLDSAYDFTPFENREIRGFNILKLIVNFILTVSILLMIHLNLSAVSDLTVEFERYRTEASTVKLKLNRHMENFNNVVNERYTYFYLKEMERMQSDSLDMYPVVADLLDKARISNVTFSEEKGNPIVDIREEIQLGGIIETDRMKNNITEELAKLQKDPAINVEDRSRYNMDKFEIQLRIKITKSKQ